MRYSEELARVMKSIIGKRTYAEVGQQAGLDATTLFRIAKYGRVPRRDTLEQIADGLGLAAGPRRDLFEAAGYVAHFSATTDTPGVGVLA